MRYVPATSLTFSEPMRQSLVVLLMLVVWCSAVPASATWQVETGYNDLAALLGDDMFYGQGVFVSQVEAYKGTAYMPDPSLVLFAASGDPVGLDTVWIDGSPGASSTGYSNHAKNVARYFYSNQGVAKAANTVVMYEANNYINSFLNGVANNAPDAPSFVDPNDGQTKQYVIQNHSWVGNLTGTANTEILKKVDYLIDEHDVTMLVGVNNQDPDDPNAPRPALDYLLAHSYNGISIGISDGQHAVGQTASLYAPGRSKPSMVTPLAADTSTSSTSTGLASGAATILYEQVQGTPGTQSEVMRAIMMGGATKLEFETFFDPVADQIDSWQRTTSEPLDNLFGAGELNILNNFLIAEGGQFSGSSSSGTPTNVGAHGWDFNSVANATSRFYEFEVPAGGLALDLSIMLTWNVEIDTFGTSAPNLDNLTLTLRDETDTIIEQSNSTDDNIEHIYIGKGQSRDLNGVQTPEYLGPGTYTLEVHGLTVGSTRDFGLAWRTTSAYGTDPNNLSTNADFDQNGFVDGLDFLRWQSNSGMLVNASLGDGDADGDGDVDQLDLDIFELQYGALPISIDAIGVPEPATVGLASVAAALAVLLSGRRACRSS